MNILEIVENRKDLLSEFIGINEQWIKHHFQIEEVDRALAENPCSIIDKGGYIFSFLDDGKVAGVCALFNEGNGVYELARMAVSPEFRQRGFGKKLMEVCISKLEQIEAKKVYLVSNTKLKAAIHLYKKSGFVTVSEGQHPVYKRANIVMEREIS